MVSKQQPLPPSTVRRVPPPRTAVVALGSIVMSDDGAGAAALSALEAGWELPSEVETMDLGTPGPYLAEMIRGFDRVIFLDTIRAAAVPGEIRVVRYDARHPPPPVQRLTPHTPDIGEALATLAFEGRTPEATIVGVVPERLEAGTELSDTMRATVPEMAGRAVAELQRLGFAVPRRGQPRSSDLWWERTTAHSA